MGTSLTGNTIASSYLGLLKTTDNAIIGSSGKRLTDGGGTDSPLYLSTGGLGIGVTPNTSFSLTVENDTWVKDQLLIGGSNGVATSGSTLTLDGGSNTSVDLRFKTNNTGNATSDGGQIGFDDSTGILFLKSYETGASNAGINITDDGGNTILFAKESSKNVGINTTSPSSKLTISGGDILLDNSNKLLWGNTSDVYIAGTTSADNIQLGVGGSTQFTFAQTTGVRLHQYGSGSITGTVTQRLGVTSSGQVVEIPIGAGAVDGSGTAGKIVKWSDTDTITDSVISESSGNIQIQGLLGVGLVPDSAVQLSVNGQIGASNNGNAGAPDFTFYGDDNTGMYRVGADSLGFTTGSTTALTLDSSQNATFAGDVTATSKKFISTSSSSGDYVRLYASSGTGKWDIYGSGADLRFSDNDSAGAIRFDTNVGIGTASITTGMKLDVQGGDFRVGDDANQGFEAGYSAGGGVVFAQGYNRGTSSFLDMKLNNAVTITAGGSVGISTTSPSSLLHVFADSSSSNEILFENDGTGDAGLTLRSDDNGNGNTFSFINFDGNDASGNNTRYASIFGQIEDSTAGAEDGQLLLTTLVNNSEVNQLKLNSSGATFAGKGIFNDSARVANNKYFEGTHSNGSTALRMIGIDNNGDMFMGGIDGNVGNVTIRDGSGNNTIVLASNNATFAGDAIFGGTSFEDNNSLARKIEITSANPVGLILNDTRDTHPMAITNDGAVMNLRYNTTAILSMDGASSASTFAGSVSILKSSLGGSTAMSDGTLIFGAGSTNYYSFRLDASADLHLDKTFSSVASTVLTIDRSTSNIGIGTTSPARPLSVNSTQISARFTSSSADSQIELTDSSGTAVLGSSSGAFLVQTGSATRLTISTSGDATFTGDIAISKDVPSIDFVDTNSNSDFRLRNNNGAFEIFDTTNSTTPLSVSSSSDATFAGKVGVGGKTAAYGLTLAQGSGVNNKIAWTDSTPNFAASIYANNSNDKLTFATKNASNAETTALEIDTSQNATFLGYVGVGTTSIPNPFSGAYDNILQVGTTTGHTRLALTSGDDKSCDLTFADSNDAADAGSTIGVISYKHNLNSMLFSVNGSEAIRIDSSQKIQAQTSGGYYLTENTTNAFSITSNGANGFLAITDEYNSSERLRITSDGDIRTSSNSHTPYIQLVNSGRTAGSPGYTFNNDVNTGMYQPSGSADTIAFSTAGSERLRFTSVGTVGINQTSPDGRLHIKFNDAAGGTINVGARIEAERTNSSSCISFKNPNGTVGTIQTLDSATSYNTSSDYRLKEDLKDFNALDIASKIKMYDFKWKADDTRSYGVMAHELQEVVPQAVSGDKDAEDMQQVDYSKLVPILLKSIQELEARVKELEKEI
tara:strand:- start:1819 stop:5916 length:4098 start_codon:yes stop_codon:yes gene_type:complete